MYQKTMMEPYNKADSRTSPVHKLPFTKTCTIKLLEDNLNIYISMLK